MSRPRRDVRTHALASLWSGFQGLATHGPSLAASPVSSLCHSGLTAALNITAAPEKQSRPFVNRYPVRSKEIGGPALFLGALTARVLLGGRTVPSR